MRPVPRSWRPRLGLAWLCQAWLGLACLVLVGCETAPASAPTAIDEAAATAWSVDREEAQGGLVSVWGSGPDDVWAAGGQQGRGLVLHNAGQGWATVETGAPGFLWWIYGRGPADIYAVGEQGLIVHYDGQAWSTVPSGTSRTLYGAWVDDAGEAWVVGGDPWGQAGSAVVLRGNAQGFQEVPLPADLRPDSLFKVYGTPAGDVVAVGTGGTILRYDGTWRRDEAPTTAPLISLWGAGGERLYAVGGEGTGLVLHFDGERWTQVGGVQAGLGLYGVFQAPGQPVFAVGAGPRIVELAAGAPAHEPVTPGTDPAMVLHSVWGDGQGAVYAVGGTLFGNPATMTGVILRRR